MREPTGLGVGIVLPFILLLVFGVIGLANPGKIAGSSFTVIDLYDPVIMVLAFVFLGIYVLPNAMVRYREIGWLRRVSVTPASPERLLAAQLIINLGLALVSILVVIFGSELIFGVSLHVSPAFFLLSIVLSIAVMFSLGLLVAALAPTQQIANTAGGGLIFLLLFLAGLWTPTTIVGGTLATIMYYSPSGAAVKALLDSAFNSTPPYTAMVILVVYAAVFSVLAVRYFRWE